MDQVRDGFLPRGGILIEGELVKDPLMHEKLGDDATHHRVVMLLIELLQHIGEHLDLVHRIGSQHLEGARSFE